MTAVSQARAAPQMPKPVLTELPGQGLGPSPWRLGLWLLLAALVPRLAVFPWAENLYGDAVVRTELAQKWAANPHWISSFADGAYQFGPLQIYLVGLALKLGVARESAGRWVSLVFGALSVLPLYALTRRLFDRRAAVVAALGLSVLGMHLQMSTTAGSEALALFLVLWALALVAGGLDENRFGALFGAGLVLNLACATRYDCWLLVPLLSVLLFFHDRDRVASATRAVLFGLTCLPFPLLWMHGNEIDKGSAFYPMRFIEDFHQGWVQAELARWGHLGFRLQGLLFWPGAALLTLSPLLAVWGGYGMWRAYRERPDCRWLLWVAWAPTLFFTFKAAVLASFVPLARFTINQVALLLPFTAFGLDGALAGARPAVKRLGWALTWGTAVLTPLCLGALTFHRDGGIASSLRPVSPVSTQPPAVMQVARFLEREVLPSNDAVVLDTDSGYWDLQIAFFSGLPEDRLARYRWDTFGAQVQKAHPRYIVRSDKGELGREVTAAGGELVFRGERFRELSGFSPPFHVYRRP